MVQRSKVAMLPKNILSWLDQTLAEGNFSDYELLAAELKKRGYDIGKSSIHRYGQKLEKRMTAIKASTAAAQLIVDTAPDDGDARSEAILALVQTEIFEAIVGLQEADEEKSKNNEKVDADKRLKVLASVGKTIAATSRASVNQKKWSVAMRDKIKAATDESEAIAKKAGMSDEDWALIRAKFLGIDVNG